MSDDVDPEAAADHLSEALLELERTDYNAPTPRELRRLLDAREEIQDESRGTRAHSICTRSTVS